MPIASFVMPVKNGEKFIASTIKSLQDQTVQDIEIIVVNDHSDDQTPNIVKKIIGQDKRVKIFDLTDKTGIGAGRNLGTSKATGKFIFPVDADDPNYTNRVEISISEIDRHKAQIFYGNLLRHYIETDKKVLRQFQPFDEQMIKTINIIPHGASAFKKEVFEKIGPYDESIKIGEDYDFFLSALDAGFKFCSKNVPLAIYTMHPGQITTTPDPEKIKQRQMWNKTVRKKHNIFQVDPEYVKKHGSPEIIDFYINKNYDIWFSRESIPIKS